MLTIYYRFGSLSTNSWGNALGFEKISELPFSTKTKKLHKSI